MPENPLPDELVEDLSSFGIKSELTIRVGYAAGRINSTLNGKTNKFGWLQAPHPPSTGIDRRSWQVILRCRTSMWNVTWE